MRIFAALAREHGVFKRMIDRMERALSWEETAARAEIREALLVFLPALDRHEEIEDMVFSDPDYAESEGAGKIIAELKREHGRVDRIRDEIHQVVELTECPWDRFERVVEELAEKLRRHFSLEERRLWPHYLRAMSRSRDRTAARRVDQAVKKLEEAVEKNRLEVSDYLEGRR